MNNNRGRALRFLALAFLCSALPGRALDFGLVIQQTGEQTGDSSYTGSYSPWISTELGQRANLYLQAKLSTVYEDGNWKPESPAILPELGLFKISWRPASSAYLEMGRLRFQDPSGMIAAGLFDGLSGSLVLGKARLSMGAFYTGLSYKETAKIIMTSGDIKAYVQPFTYTDSDTYFSSRRIVVSAGTEFGDLSPRTTLKVNVLGQFDMNPKALSDESLLHTQYLSAQYSCLPLETLALTGTVVGGLAEDEEKAIYLQCAMGAGIDWEVPGALQDMLQGEIHWSNGENEGLIAFAPINSIAQGTVFDPKLSGLMALKGKYTARLYQSFSVSAEGIYFIRTDGKTLTGTEYPPSSSRLMGGELYGTVRWALTEDLMINIGGGAFFPGDAFVPNTPIRWKLAAGLIFSL
ncbi:MAG: hypothetical protein LBT39_11590 [Treponema sp.]|jgi:hypothetical protein|nr:hypothetical protein [Treponema sp.]